MLRLPAVVVMLVSLGCVNLSRPQALVSDGPTPGADATGGRPGDAGAEAAAEAASDLSTDSDEDPDLDGPDGDGGGSDLAVEVAPPDAPLATNGDPCQEAGQCASGHCVRAICCDTACTADCFSCAVGGMIGVCTAVPAGDDPGNHCDQDLPSTCRRDGTCDGQGGCRTYQASTLCAPGSCINDVETAASTCDGNGTCVAGASQSCSPNICMGATCGKVCTTDSQCQTGFFCAGSNCAVKKPQAAICTGSNQCSSGHCVDGVCCASACSNMCFSCNLPGTVGVCTAAASGQDPRSQCPIQAQSTCGRAGGCNGVGGCRLWPATTTCAAGACSGSTETSARQCNGAGVCLAATTRNCAPYLCGAGACATSCNSSADCQAGLACIANSCSALPGLLLHWRFEEGSGTVAADSSGNNLDGLYTGEMGTPIPSPARPPALRYPNSLSRDFAMANRHTVTLASTPASLRPANNLTISVWYRATAVDVGIGGTTPLGSELVSLGNHYLLRLRATAPAGLEASKRTLGGVVSCRAEASGFLDGSWRHAAVVFSTSAMTVYYGGAVLCSQPNGADFTYGGGMGLFVGRHGSGEIQWDFGGNLDEVRIYNRALSPEEILHLAGGGT